MYNLIARDEPRTRIYQSQWLYLSGGGAGMDELYDPSPTPPGPPPGGEERERSWNYVWPPDIWPTFWPGTVEIWSDFLGTVGIYTEPPPNIPMESCAVCDETQFSCDWLNRYSRGAQSVVLLETRGKASSTRRNLISLQYLATDIRSKRWRPQMEVPPADYASIPGDQIEVPGLGKKVGADGKLYVVLPDNAVRNITAMVRDVAFYTYDVVPQKHRLITQTFAAVPQDRSRTTVGVGEEIRLFFAPALPTTTTWSATGGSLVPDVESRTVFTAPSNAANVTVTAHVGGASLAKAFTVLEPSGYAAALISSTPDRFGAGHCGAMMYLKVWFGPRNVSLYRVQIEEVGLDPTVMWGYYANKNPANYHHYSDTFIGLNEDNSWTSLDWCQGGASDPPPPYAPGGLTWTIPARWRIEGGAEHPMQGWDEVFTLDAAGTFRIEKFGVWVQRTLDGVISFGP